MQKAQTTEKQIPFQLKWWPLRWSDKTYGVFSPIHVDFAFPEVGLTLKSYLIDASQNAFSREICYKTI